jgi:ribose transport system permease protein
VAAAVIGGTSIFGGRGTYSGTIVGALILTVLTTMLTVLQMPEGHAAHPVRGDHPGVTAIYIRITEDS